MNDRPLTPSSTSIVLPQHEFDKRAAPGGRMPTDTKDVGDRTGKWNSIADGSPNAVAGEAERQVRRNRPELAAKRMAKGK
jgi:hypothetical protein